MPALLISVRFHDGRYHGRPDWPPSPARLFQALVAGAARGKAIAKVDARALEWLETLDAPTIAAPPHRPGQSFSNYVPNNDLDAVDRDPARVSEIRAPKLIRPILFAAEAPFLYVWRFEDAARDNAQRICVIAARLYQLGRSVDMAWATAEILDDDQIENRLATYDGAIHRPSEGGEGAMLAAPMEGTLASLMRRHTHVRFENVRSNRKDAQLFKQPPRPLFRQVAYDSPPARLLYDLIGKQTPVPLKDIATFTERLRDAAAARLTDKLKGEAGEIERCLIGRDADEQDKARRVRIIPLPSIGHPKASPAIRRVLVEIPAACPLPARDIDWAFSGLELVPARIHEETGEIDEQLTLAATSDARMLRHYGIGERATTSRLWRTITPAALSAARRRIAPEMRREQQKGGGERAHEECAAIASVRTALRHAGVGARVETVRVQREPWAAKGARAEAFEPGKAELKQRFSKHRLWHVEIAFAEPRQGPLLIGDGRYLGLGLMHPVQHACGVFALHIVDGLSDGAAHTDLTRALRRAVMALIAERSDTGKPLPTFFTGHGEDGAPARSGRHRHLAFVFDAGRRRLLIVAPHVLERRPPTRHEQKRLSLLSEAISGLRDLRAGAAGRLRLSPAWLDQETDPLFAPSKVWESVTPFLVTRHAKLKDAHAALESNIMDEVRRIGLPAPHVEILRAASASEAGLGGLARLTFVTAVAGPLLIGRDLHGGGGLFCGRTTASAH